MQLQSVLVFWLITIIIAAVGIPPLSGRRTFYISPGKSDLQVNCPADQCYSLQDVISNQSYFFDSYTTLELMPGRYNITEKVGQLVIDQVQNVLVKRSVVGQKYNVTIQCDSNATFGITIIGSSNVTISGLQIIHCSAALSQKQRNYMVHYNIGGHYPVLRRYLKQWFDNKISCDSELMILPCIATIFFIDNLEVTMQQTIILRSQHVGLFTIKIYVHNWLLDGL